MQVERHSEVMNGLCGAEVIGGDSFFEGRGEAGVSESRFQRETFVEGNADGERKREGQLVIRRADGVWLLRGLPEGGGRASYGGVGISVALTSRKVIAGGHGRGSGGLR